MVQPREDERLEATNHPIYTGRSSEPNLHEDMFHVNFLRGVVEPKDSSEEVMKDTQNIIL